MEPVDSCGLGGTDALSTSALWSSLRAIELLLSAPTVEYVSVFSDLPPAEGHWSPPA